MNNILIFQSDFGLVDGAVSAMEGVAKLVSKDLELHNLTHDIPPFNTWEASYRLFQTIKFWPKGTTFVSVVDPGVGSKRKSVVAKIKNGSLIVTPDNGTLTHIYNSIGIEEVRIIDETKHRLSGSDFSHTFHGRDVYSYTGAKLASNTITFEEIGQLLPLEEVVRLNTNEIIVESGYVKGSIDILDTRFGSIWTNITKDKFEESNIQFGDKVSVKIMNNNMVVYNNIINYVTSFSEVNVGETLVYINSLIMVAVAINQGNFSLAYNIGTGANWSVEFKKIEI